MENGQKGIISETQGSFSMRPIDQRNHSRGHSDIMTRRLKNRERQRRYRARKRLEADKKSSTENNSTPPEVHFQLNGIINNFSSRVHCKRNWKKDARMANSCKHPEAITKSSINPQLMVTSESQIPCLASKSMVGLPLEKESHSEVPLCQVTGVTQKNAVGRRDWKADARKKKNQTDT